MASSTNVTSVVGILLVLYPVLLAAADKILAACKTVGGGSTYFDVMFCVEALGSVAGALNCPDLVAVAVDLLPANGTSTEAKIERLLGVGSVRLELKMEEEDDATVGGGSTYFDVMFCVEALGSVAGALNCPDLVAVAVDLVPASGTSTEAKIERLLRVGSVRLKLKMEEEDDATVERCLRSCQSMYGGIVDGGPACTAAVKGGRFGDATVILEKAVATAKECEDGFWKSNAASPLTPEDDHAF